MSQKPKWRFAFQITEGANAGLGAGSWRVWATGSDLYVAPADLAATVKASLHASGRWRVGYTAEHMASDRPLWDADLNRAPWTFPAPPIVDGIQEAFVIATWRNALRPTSPASNEVVVEVQDRWDVLTGVKIWVTEPGKAFPTPDTLVMSEPLTLSNGWKAWLSKFEDITGHAAPEPVPLGQLIEVWLPPEADVACPGFLVRGVNIG